MAPARIPPDQATMREILARVDGVAKQVEDVGKDAREARDATIELKARLSAENSQEQIAKIWARMEAADTAHRSDLLNAISRTGDRVGKAEARVSDLEAWRQRLEGANGLVRWLSRYAPWLVSALVAGYAYVHGGGKLP